MILGDVCTRACRFCGVATGRPGEVAADEPVEVASAVETLGLQYVVVTSVTRDDLDDEGAGHFARTIRAVKERVPGVKVEVLIPDLHAREDFLNVVVEAGPDVVAHNIETVRRISPVLRPQADHDRSLRTLAVLRRLAKGAVVKSGFMVGLGETDDEVSGAFEELKDAGCELVTVGQYLPPTKTGRNVPVFRYVEPEAFEKYRQEGLRRGLAAVVAGPLVRSSYLAEEHFEACIRLNEGSTA